MKYLLALFLLAGMYTQTQANNYQFTYNDKQYAPIKNGRTVELDKSFFNGFPLTSEFRLLGKEVIKVERISNNGEVFFSTLDGSQLFLSTLNDEGLKKNLEQGIFMNSSIVYGHDYENNKKVFKLEWKWNKTGATQDLAYQLWIFEDGNFEVHFSDAYSNELLGMHTMIGVGYTNETLTDKTYAFGTNPRLLGVHEKAMISKKGVAYTFEQNDFIDVVTSVNYQMDNSTNMDLFIELEERENIKISIDDKEGNVLYAESLQDGHFIERNIDIENESDVYYIHVETPEKIYVKQVALR